MHLYMHLLQIFCILKNIFAYTIIEIKFLTCLSYPTLKIVNLIKHLNKFLNTLIFIISKIVLFELDLK